MNKEYKKLKKCGRVLYYLQNRLAAGLARKSVKKALKHIKRGMIELGKPPSPVPDHGRDGWIEDDDISNLMGG